MRRLLLIRSAQQLVGDDHPVSAAVYMWHRTRLWLPFVVATALLSGFVAWIADLETANVVVIAVAVAGVASFASTRYFVLARSGDTIWLMTGSPIKRVARATVRSDLTTADISAAGNTMLATDWSIANDTYTVPKSCEQDMQVIIA